MSTIPASIEAIEKFLAESGKFAGRKSSDPIFGLNGVDLIPDDLRALVAAARESYPDTYALLDSEGDWWVLSSASDSWVCLAGRTPRTTDLVLRNPLASRWNALDEGASLLIDQYGIRA